MIKLLAVMGCGSGGDFLLGILVAKRLFRMYVIERGLNCEEKIGYLWRCFKRSTWMEEE
jgi:hypothetical protein